jgi:hypothetical protein
MPIFEPPPASAPRQTADDIPWSSDDDGATNYRDSARDLTGDYFCLNFAHWE